MRMVVPCRLTLFSSLGLNSVSVLLGLGLNMVCLGLGLVVVSVHLVLLVSWSHISWSLRHKCCLLAIGKMDKWHFRTENWAKRSSLRLRNLRTKKIKHKQLPWQWSFSLITWGGQTPSLQFCSRLFLGQSINIIVHGKKIFWTLFFLTSLLLSLPKGQKNRTATSNCLTGASVCKHWS